MASANGHVSNSSSSIQRSYLERPDGAKIYYDVIGTGPQPILLLAPGGMKSQAACWKKGPWNPIERLKVNPEFTLIAMDQRYSWEGIIPEDANIGWNTFRDDQVALLDHLQLLQHKNNNKKCHIVASCIGPSYGLQLLRDYPSRFEKVVWLQPIGISHHTTEPTPWEGDNRGAEKEHWFGQWAQKMVQDGRASQTTIDRMHANMFVDRDFCFTITRTELQRMDQENDPKMLLFCGRDIFHPAEIAREIGRLAPRSTVAVVEEWRNAGDEKLEEANEIIQEFLLHGE